MNWADVGKKIVSAGAPLLGGAIGGPAGAGIGAIIADVFGVNNDPESIIRAIDRDPAAAVKLQEIQSNERIRLQEIASAQVLAEVEATTERMRIINDTIRTEYNTESIYKAGWRPFIGWTFGICIMAIVCAMTFAIFDNPLIVSDDEFAGMLVWLFTAMGAVLGINIRERSNDKLANRGIVRSGVIQKLTDTIKK